MWRLLLLSAICGCAHSWTTGLVNDTFVKCDDEGLCFANYPGNRRKFVRIPASDAASVAGPTEHLASDGTFFVEEGALRFQGTNANNLFSWAWECQCGATQSSGGQSSGGQSSGGEVTGPFNGGVGWGFNVYGGDPYKKYCLIEGGCGADFVPEGSLTNMEQVYVVDGAFVAEHTDGTWSHWGHPNNLGDFGESYTNNIKTLYAGSDMFAALKNDGTVYCKHCGSDMVDIVDIVTGEAGGFAAINSQGLIAKTWGGQYPPGGSDLQDLNDFISEGNALELTIEIKWSGSHLIVLRSDGELRAAGSLYGGGLLTFTKNNGHGVSELLTLPKYSNAFLVKFADCDDCAAIWGAGKNLPVRPAGCGWDSTDVCFHNVDSVLATNTASFALKYKDGSTKTWGWATGGQATGAKGDEVHVENVSQVLASEKAFAALKDDGTVVAWGEASNGGDASSVQDQLTGVSAIYANGFAFAALKADGSVVTWGNEVFGGDSSLVQGDLQNVVKIFNTRAAFTALTSGGGVVTWGNENYGGDIFGKGGTKVSREDSGIDLTSGVATVYSNSVAFFAVGK